DRRHPRRGGRLGGRAAGARGAGVPRGVRRGGTMSCPDVGVWRAWLDGEAAGEAEGLAEHLAACASCAGLVGELPATAALGGTAIGALGPSLVPAAPAAAPFSRRDRTGRPAEVAVLAPRAHTTLAAEEAPDMAQTIQDWEQRRITGLPRRWRLIAA